MAIHSSTLAWKIPRTEKPDLWASQMALKNPPANAGDVRDAGLIPGSGRSPGGGHGNPLQYFCLKNRIDGEAGLATVQRVTKS